MPTIDQDTGEIVINHSLAHYEAIIARGLQTFYDVGCALAAIRDGDMYKDAGYKTFETYCADRWDMTRQRAYQLTDAAAIVETLSTMVDIIPSNERQARPLIAFRDDPDLQRIAWQRAVEQAPNGRVTAELVERAVLEISQSLKEKDAAPPLPPGKYRTIVIDPPWEMDKIARDVRPKQVTLDYPTMNEDDLKAFPIPDLAADNCHLYLWTTHKYIPLALRLAEHWGFRYQCMLTWVKNVGFTPFSWMYSTEHALFCRRGGLDLLQLGRRLDVHASVREHSRKPNEFYDLVFEVSPEPRLDIFAREPHFGFETWGNEAELFAQESDNDNSMAN